MIERIVYIDGVKSYAYGPWYFLWIIHFNVVSIIAFYRFIKLFRQSEGLVREHLKYIIVGTLCPYVLAGFTNVFAPSFGYCQWQWMGPPLASSWLLFVSYTIIKHQILDIRIVITRVTIFIFVYTLVLGIPFAMTFWFYERLIDYFDESWWMVPMTTLTVLALAGPYLYLYMQRHAEDRLLKEQRQYQNTLRQASLGMGRIKEFKKLLSFIVHILCQSVRSDHAMVYFYSSEKGKFILGAQRQHKGVHAPETIDAASGAIAHLQSKKLPVAYDEIHENSLNDRNVILFKLVELMQALEASVIIPCMMDESLLAFIVVGKKKEGKAYTLDDLAAFAILANQAALAIENLKSLEEIKRAQEKLFHAEKLAYVGQLASSIVHEVRNPLTAIKTFVQYLPEKFQNRDLGFLERFNCVIPREINRLEKIVCDLLDLARPRKSIKKQERISEILRQTLDLLVDSFQLRKVRVELASPADDYFFCDAKQLQQVFLNLFLNALDAMPEGGELKVNVSRDNQKLFIKVKDTGCGIPPETLKQLFTAFQTTKPLGVGLGLVISQEIVKLHGGEILVDSAPGQGAEFCIQLPFPHLS